MSFPSEVGSATLDLTFAGMLKSLKQAIVNFKDKRRGKNSQYSMEDAVLSGFSIFYLQCPSFLSYQQAMENDKGNNNARTLFGINKIPSDNQVRNLLDEGSPNILFSVFEDIFNAICSAGWIKNFRGKTNSLLLAFDGVQHHHSHKIQCGECKKTTHHNGSISYSHSMVTAVLVKPDCPHVLNLPPEFIVPQDGHLKQDCEIEGAKRWLNQHASKYNAHGPITILGDDLYAHQPFIEALKKEKLHFILSCLPGSHKTLYEFIEGLRSENFIESVEVKRWTGKRHEFDTYIYINEVPLKDGKDALRVNFCELITKDANGKILFKNAYITDYKIDAENVADIVKDGRTRWKTENENNNTLKRQGYNLEHNFGHGKKYLCNVLATLNLIAFLFHTILAISSQAYHEIRKHIGARQRLFEHLRILVHYILFESWDDLMSFILKELKIKSFQETFVPGLG
ncbi:MAG TPA: ISNCY family transposase [Waddliaceae bacterium]